MKTRTLMFISMLIFLISLGPASIPNHSSLSRLILTIPAGGEYTLKFGESVTFNDLRLTITFTSVLEEARCPEDVICFWAGFVTVQVLLGFHNSSSNFYNLTLGLESSLSWINLTLNTFTYSIRLIAVDPLPISTHQTLQSDYCITFTLTLQNPDKTISSPPLLTSILTTSSFFSTTPPTVTSPTSEPIETQKTTHSTTTGTITPGFSHFIPYLAFLAVIFAYNIWNKRGKRR